MGEGRFSPHVTRANIFHSLIGASALVIVALGCSIVWSSAVNHGNDDRVKIIRMQQETIRRK